MSDTKRATAWRDYVMGCGDQIRWGTTAIHQLGDISRPKGDYFRVESVTAGAYVGNWLTGYGFVGVRFPAESSRSLTEDERQWLADHPVVIR